MKKCISRLGKFHYYVYFTISFLHLNYVNGLSRKVRDVDFNYILGYKNTEFKDKIKTDISWIEEHVHVTNKFRIAHHVPPIDIDYKLCLDAQEWATELGRRSDKKKELKLRLTRKLYTGENLYGAGKDDDVTGTKVAEKWYYDCYNHNWTTNYFNRTSGDFTDLIWKDVNRMGIAKIQSPVLGVQIIVARYLPCGNWGYYISFKRNVFPYTPTTPCWPHGGIPKDFPATIKTTTTEATTTPCHCHPADNGNLQKSDSSIPTEPTLEIPATETAKKENLELPVTAETVEDTSEPTVPTESSPGPSEPTDATDTTTGTSDGVIEKATATVDTESPTEVTQPEVRTAAPKTKKPKRFSHGRFVELYDKIKGFHNRTAAGNVNRANYLNDYDF